MNTLTCYARRLEKAEDYSHFYHIFCENMSENLLILATTSTEHGFNTELTVYACVHEFNKY